MRVQPFQMESKNIRKSEKCFNLVNMGKKRTTTKKSKMVSTKTLHDAGELGIVRPQPKPESMSMQDYIKSVLHIAIPGTEQTYGDVIIQKQCELASMGSAKSAEFLFDRAYGKPTQTVQVATGQPVINIEHRVISIDEARARGDGEVK